MTPRIKYFCTKGYSSIIGTLAAVLVLAFMLYMLLRPNKYDENAVCGKPVAVQK